MFTWKKGLGELDQKVKTSNQKLKWENILESVCATS